MENSNSVATPLHSSTRLSTATLEDVKVHSAYPYQEIVGCLNHAAVSTRPDNAHAVSQLAQSLLSYGSAHVPAAEHLLRYIKGTFDIGLLFGNHSSPSHKISGYADADYANNVDTRWSTTGYTITVGGSTVCWRSLRQQSVALPTTKAKHMAMGDCAKHLLWFRRLLYILTMKAVPTTPIRMLATAVFNDKNGAVFLSKEAAVNSRSKHINIGHHFIRDIVRDEIIRPAMIDTKAMPADYLTKAGNSIVLARCRLLVGNFSQQEHLVSAADP